MKIVITYPYPIGQANGGARHLREIARHLGMLGNSVTVIAVSSNPLPHFPRKKINDRDLGMEFDEPLSKYGVEVVRIPQNPVHFVFDGLPVKRALRRILAKQQVDIVLSYYHEAAFLPSFLKRRNVPFGYFAIWQHYGAALRGKKKGILGFVEKQMQWRSVISPHRSADVLFASSMFTRDDLVRSVGVDRDRIVVCPFGADHGFSDIPRKPLKEVARFLFFGRINPSKGVEDALEALGKLKAKGLTNWHYRIVGEGRMAWAEGLIRKYDVTSHVTLTGPADDAGLRRELEDADLAIMPSRRESFGLSIAEAQAAGVPVIAFQAGSVPEVVEHGVTGWLAPLRKVDRLADYIEQAIQNPELTHQAGLAARERMRMFKWKDTAAIVVKGISSVRGLRKRVSEDTISQETAKSERA